MGASAVPGYLLLHESGELAKRVHRAVDLLQDCTVCPQCCHVDRQVDDLGFCRTGRLARVSSYGPHFGEEPPLVGRNGSGTIFLANCNMRCEFCQNYEISQCGYGSPVPAEGLADMMLRLQERGCHNINFVSPSHVVPQILEAVSIAAGRGLYIPLVYNSGGYDRAHTLRLLDGVFDIYMPDAKYGRDEIAEALSHAPRYTEYMYSALKEMHRQVGDLIVQDGIAVRGLIIRHLVLPRDLADSETVMRFIAEEISRDSYVNIMDQYRVVRATSREELQNNPYLAQIQRPITGSEYRYAIECAQKVGLHRFAD